MSATFHKDQYKFLITSRSILLKMRNVTEKVAEKSKQKFYIQ